MAFLNSMVIGLLKTIVKVMVYLVFNKAVFLKIYAANPQKN